MSDTAPSSAAKLGGWGSPNKMRFWVYLGTALSQAGWRMEDAERLAGNVPMGIADAFSKVEGVGWSLEALHWLLCLHLPCCTLHREGASLLLAEWSCLLWCSFLQDPYLWAVKGMNVVGSELPVKGGGLLVSLGC